MKTKFKVWCSDEGGTEAEAKVFSAYCHEGAAEDWAEHFECDSATNDICCGKIHLVVHVKDTTSGETKLFRVGGEYTPSYFVTEVEDTTP